MCTNLGCRVGLRQVLSGLICLWLAIGPVLAAGSLWVSAPVCCCGTGSACLLGGCNCGGQATQDSSPCGGLRSADDFGGDATILSFGLRPCLAAQEISENTVDPIGQAQVDEWSLLNLLVRSLEPPPPRLARVC